MTVLRKGNIVSLFLDHKENQKPVGKGVLLMKVNPTLPALSFVSDTENDEKEKINAYLLTNSTFNGEFKGKEYSVKAKALRYNLYTSETWLVEFLESNVYPKNFKKTMPIRKLIASYSSLKELSELTINTQSEVEIEDIYNEKD